MANTILVKVVFGRGIFFHFFRFPEVDGSSVEDSRARLFVNRKLHIRTNSHFLSLKRNSIRNLPFHPDFLEDYDGAKEEIGDGLPKVFR
jgi:hypothetical protein